MNKTDFVRARVELGIKQEATAVLERMGLRVSDAIRILFIRIATDKTFPFDIGASSLVARGRSEANVDDDG